MTASIHNTVRWTEVLEAKLNASRKWRARVGGAFTRVINFGVDGMGMIQFAAMLRHHAMDFEPDLVVVNFISDDILRRFRYKSNPPRVANREESIRHYVKKNFLDHIDWFGLCPEAIMVAAAAVRPNLGTPCSLPFGPRQIIASGPAFHFRKRKEAVATSIAAVKDMLEVAPRIVFLQMRIYQEYLNQPLPVWRGLVDDVRKGVPEARFVSMLKQMDAHLEGKRLSDRPDLAGLKVRQMIELPDDRKLELHRWFFFPDQHYTDDGATIYAREVAKYLIDRVPDEIVVPIAARTGK